MEFISKYRKYKIWLVPARYLVDSYGQRSFQAGRFARFEEGRYETSDPEEIKMLKANPRYGIDFKSTTQEGEELTPAAKQSLANDAAALETTVTACPHCSFKAKTHLGLLSHIRSKHPDKL